MVVVSRTHVVAARLRPRSGGGRERYLSKGTHNGCAIRASDESKTEARRACDPRGPPFPEGHGSAPALQSQPGVAALWLLSHL